MWAKSYIISHVPSSLVLSKHPPLLSSQHARYSPLMTRQEFIALGLLLPDLKERDCLDDNFDIPSGHPMTFDSRFLSAKESHLECSCRRILDGIAGQRRNDDAPFLNFCPTGESLFSAIFERVLNDNMLVAFCRENEKGYS